MSSNLAVLLALLTVTIVLLLLIAREFRRKSGPASAPQEPMAEPDGGFAAANDNGPKSRRAGSTMAVYQTPVGQHLVTLNLCPAEAARVGLTIGERVKFTAAGDVIVLTKATKRGVAIKDANTALSIRSTVPGATLASARRVTLSRMVDGSVLVAPATQAPTADQPSNAIFPLSFLDGFKSLMVRGGKERRAYLAANLNQQQAQSTTPAGDQAFTSISFIWVILRAGLRQMFDIDVCSMRSDGRYDLGLSKDVIKRSMSKCHVNPKKRLPVIGAVPAKRHMTKDDSDFGSLLLPWNGEFIWLNPPYTNRAWITFLEKAAIEVASGRAGIIVSLVPMDTFGAHIRHMYGPDAYRIELSGKVPFFMPRRKLSNGTVQRNVVATIKGNSLVVFGKGTKTRDFLLLLLDELLADGFITKEQAAHHREEYAVLPNLQQAA